MPAVVLSAGKLLSVGFEQAGDRHAHWIEVGDDAAGGQRWLESIEGTASESWPASPALQSLHVEERGRDIRVALLVGMAGGSHWSMSVEADASRGQLTFDVACRTRDVPAFLGSSYRAFAQPAAVRDDGGLRWSFGKEELELELDTSAGQTRAECLAERLTIVPGLIAVAGPRTYRWRYCLRVNGEEAVDR